MINNSFNKHSPSVIVQKTDSPAPKLMWLVETEVDMTWNHTDIIWQLRWKLMKLLIYSSSWWSRYFFIFCWAQNDAAPFTKIKVNGDKQCQKPVCLQQLSSSQQMQDSSHTEIRLWSSAVTVNNNKIQKKKIGNLNKAEINVKWSCINLILSCANLISLYIQ